MNKHKETSYCIMGVASCLLAVAIIVAAALFGYGKYLKDRDNDKISALNAEIETLQSNQAQYESEMEKRLEDSVDGERQKALADKTSMLDGIRSALESGKSTIKALAPLYPDHMLVTSGGRVNFVPIDWSLKQRTFSADELVTDPVTGEYTIVRDGTVVSHKGVDVSKYQGKIDWAQVAESGVEWAIMRFGIRGYGAEGRLVLDETFDRNIREAHDAGIKVGAYFYTQAVTVSEAVEEVDLLVNTIREKGIKLDLPIVCDVEKTSDGSGRMNQLSREERTKVVRAWVDRVCDLGYAPMIYANTEMWMVLLDMSEFEDIPKWFAYYGEDLYLPYEYDIWQYSQSGTVPGFEGSVDMDIYIGDYRW